MLKIDSISNKKIKYFYSLKEKKNILKEKKFLVEGENIIGEALKNNLVLTLIITDENLYEKESVERILVSKEIIKKISFVKTNVGAIAICKYQPLQIEENKLNKIIVLDEVRDPMNLGLIIRTAKGFNYDALVLLNNSVFSFNEKVIRTSQGSIFSFPIIETNNLEILRNFKCFYFILRNEDSYMNEIKSISSKFALIFGNEKKGISNDLLNNLKGEKIKIKINSDLESLNLAISSAIAMYYFSNII
ncbi:MAG: RNA methyltransferase [Candidatus Hepatoplasma vulgare]|nr:MAG: RNA methyltransferase [Candidatus Hepatoplasma sp.]